MAENDLFQPEANEIPAVDPSKDHYAELVGEGKKYVDNQALARAAAEKDAFIERLKQEQKELRGALSTRIKEEEFLTKLETLTSRESPTLETPSSEQRDATGVTEEDINAILERREAEQKRNANLKIVEDHLRSTFGTDFKVRVNAIAKTLNVGTDTLTSVAAKSPEAFFKLMGLSETKPESFSPPPRSSVELRGNVSSERNYAYWQAQRKEKGDSWYFNPAVQNEIFKEAKRFGEDFYKK